MRAVGDRWGTGFALRLLGVMRMRSGEPGRAAALLSSSSAEFTAIGARGEMLETRVFVAEQLVLDGRPAEAIAVLDGIEDERKASGVDAATSAMHRTRGLALGQLGDLDGAGIAVEAALDEARLDGAVHEIGLALDASAQLDAARGMAPSRWTPRSSPTSPAGSGSSPGRYRGWAPRSAEREAGVGVEEDEVAGLAGEGPRDPHARDR